MSKIQFRILYREFLFRVVDLEILSADAQGDASKILGQFAALLVLLDAFAGLTILTSAGNRLPQTPLLLGTLEHFMIATTMLVVGLFAVLSWDSTFPDRRDVMVLAPLPVSTRTMFLAKIAASATPLGVTVLALNALPNLAFPLALAPPSRSILDWLFAPEIYRSFAAYAVTVISAGGFIFASVLCIQGLAAQLLPRRQFLRVSAFLQMAAFILLVTVYFLEPQLATPQALAAPQNQRLLAWLPSYWFLALFQQLNGSMHPALVPLVQRAWIALAIVGSGTAVVYMLSYFRTLRKIVEQPDIMPGSRGGTWLPRFGNSLETAVTQFSVRTLLRSRQHRLILAFYFGIGFAVTILFLKTPVAQKLLAGHRVSGPMLASSIVMLIAWIVGARMVFSMPLDLRANWIFRIMPIRGGSACLGARRRALAVLTIAPAALLWATLFLSLWPWQAAIGHVLILMVFGIILTELCLYGKQKIPFTCSYLPGRSNFHLTFWICIFGLMNLVGAWTAFELRALGDLKTWVTVLAILSVAAMLARWRTSAEAKSEEMELTFEQEESPVIMSLGLHRDGTLPMENP